MNNTTAEINTVLEQAYPAQIGYLQKIVESGKISTAYCIVGVPGGAQREMTRWFTDQLVQESPHFFTTDILEISATPPSHTIGIESAHAIRKHLALRANEGGRRLVIIHNADELSISAANALLKTIEEPAGNAHILMHSAHPELLPKTIQSRVQCIRTAQLSDAFTQSFIKEKGVDQADTAQLSHFVHGQLSRLIGSPDAESIEWWKENMNFWITFFSSETGKRDTMLQERFLKTTKGNESSHQLLSMLELLQQLLHEQLLSTYGIHSARHPLSTAIDELAAQQDASLISRRLQLITTLQQWTKDNTNKKMIFEYLTFVL